MCSGYKLRPCLVHLKNQKLFQNFPSHRILQHIYEALNIDESKKIITQFICKSVVTL